MSISEPSQEGERKTYREREREGDREGASRVGALKMPV